MARRVGEAQKRMLLRPNLSRACSRRFEASGDQFPLPVVASATASRPSSQLKRSPLKPSPSALAVGTVAIVTGDLGVGHAEFVSAVVTAVAASR